MRTRPVTRAVLGTALVAALLTAAACADAPVSPAVPAAPAATSGPVTSTPALPADRRLAVDVSYGQMMLPHVTQGLALTGMAPGRVSDPDLARLVTEMDHADAEEQGQLTGQLHVWGARVPGERGADGRARPVARMPGMTDDATLDRLRSLRGPAFDRAWLAVMIAHHQGGIDMSRDYLAQGTGGELSGIAEATIGNGGRQLDRMRALLTRT